MYTLLDNEDIEEGLKNRTMLELKSKVCNEKQRLYCCDTEEKKKEPEGAEDESFIPRAEFGECGQNSAKFSQMIIGGKNTLPGEFPFSARIRPVQKNSLGEIIGVGSGTLISRWYVLTSATAAAPNDIYESVEVVLGEWDLSSRLDCSSRFCLPETQVFLVNQPSIFVHRNFQKLPLENNIALLKLPQPAKTNFGVQMACLPPPGLDYAGGKVDTVGRCKNFLNVQIS